MSVIHAMANIAHPIGPDNKRNSITTEPGGVFPAAFLPTYIIIKNHISDKLTANVIILTVNMSMQVFMLYGQKL